LQHTMERQLRLRAERSVRKEREARGDSDDSLPEVRPISTPAVPKAFKAKALHAEAMASARGARTSSPPAEPREVEAQQEAQCVAVDVPVGVEGGDARDDEPAERPPRVQPVAEDIHDEL
jgi:hypothetical protein